MFTLYSDMWNNEPIVINYGSYLNSGKVLKIPKRFQSSLSKPW